MFDVTTVFKFYHISAFNVNVLLLQNALCPCLEEAELECLCPEGSGCTSHFHISHEGEEHVGCIVTTHLPEVNIPL